jgi:hypothetical protein
MKKCWENSFCRERLTHQRKEVHRPEACATSCASAWAPEDLFACYPGVRFCWTAAALFMIKFSQVNQVSYRYKNNCDYI